MGDIDKSLFYRKQAKQPINSRENDKQAIYNTTEHRTEQCILRIPKDYYYSDRTHINLSAKRNQ